MSGGAAPKAKGSRFERDLCAKLSRWISHGISDDLLWRSAMSGGRGTIRHGKHGAQKVSGDICAISPEGHDLTDAYHIEAKHVRDMHFAAFVIKGNGWLATEWNRCKRQAQQHDKQPLMIVKQNLYPTLVLQVWRTPASLRDGIFLPMHGCVLRLLDDMLTEPFTIPRAKLTVPRFSDTPHGYGFKDTP